MIKNNNLNIKNSARISLIMSDLLSVFIPAIFVYTFADVIDNHEYFRFRTFFGVGLFAISILFWSQTFFAHYTIRRSLYDEFTELIQIYVFNGLAVLSSLFIFQLSTERNKHILFLSLVFAIIPLSRYVFRRILDKYGLWKLECLIFCPRSEFDYAKTAIESQFNLGMVVRRSVFENRILMQTINKYNKGDFDYHNLKKQILEYHQSLGYPHIIIFSHRKNAIYVPKIVELVIACDLPYSIIPDIGGVSLLGMRISHFFRWEVLLITPQNNIERLSYQILKRSFDILVGIIFIILLFIPMLIIYLLIKMDGGPAIFIHDRIGKNGNVFRCFKFRSMVVDSSRILSGLLIDNELVRIQWQSNQKIIDDPRVTLIGKFLRKTSLDELPQLYNVVMGDMSLVGPRPIVEAEIQKYGRSFDTYCKVRPGITGLWQISGRSNTSYDYRVALDVWYVKNWSLWYDLAIITKTIDVVLRGRGAH